MTPRRGKSSTKTTGVFKPSQRFLIAKSGKLSKTNLHGLFSDPETWTSLTPEQQLSALLALKVRSLFGEGHPQKLSIGAAGSGDQADSGEVGYMNYFNTPDPLATTVAPSLDGSTADTVELSGEVYFDLTTHVERFKQHLKEGHFDPKWIARSEEERLRRVRGDFDGFWKMGTGDEGSLGEEGLDRVREVRRRRVERRERGVE